MTLSRIQTKKARAKSKTMIACVIIGSVLIAGIAAAVVANSPFVQVSAKADSPLKAASSAASIKPVLKNPVNPLSFHPVTISVNKTVSPGPAPQLRPLVKTNQTAEAKPAPAAKPAAPVKSVAKPVQKAAVVKPAAVQPDPVQHAAKTSHPAAPHHKVVVHPAAAHAAAAPHQAAKQVEKPAITAVKPALKTVTKPVSIASQTKEMLGRVLSADKNSVVLEVEGQHTVFVSDGSPLVQNEISQLQPDNTIVVRYQGVNGHYLIKDLFVVYTHTLGELAQYIDADYGGMADSHSIEVYVNHKPQVFQLSPAFIGENLDKKFAPGAKVELAAVKTTAGLIVENISGL